MWVSSTHECFFLRCWGNDRIHGVWEASSLQAPGLASKPITYIASYTAGMMILIYSVWQIGFRVYGLGSRGSDLRPGLQYDAGSVDVMNM